MGFGFELGRRHLLGDDFANLEGFFSDKSGEDLLSQEIPGEAGTDSRGALLHLRKVRFDPADRQEFMALGLIAPVELLQGPSFAVGRRSAWIAVALVLIGSTLVVAYLNRALKPFSLFVRSTDRIADGDFQVELPPESEDEIGRLSVSFRRMVHQLDARREEIEKQKADLAKTNHRLEAARKGALAASQAKSDFLATMSHEIRTPMTAILGMTDLLLETGLQEDQRRYMEVLRRAGQNLHELINGVLDLAKIESGRFELESVDFDLEDVVEAVR